MPNVMIGSKITDGLPLNRRIRIRKATFTANPEVLST